MRLLILIQILIIVIIVIIGIRVIIVIIIIVIIVIIVSRKDPLLLLQDRREEPFILTCLHSPLADMFTRVRTSSHIQSHCSHMVTHAPHGNALPVPSSYRFMLALFLSSFTMVLHMLS